MKISKGTIVLLDPQSKKVLQTIELQYNPESVTRSLQAQTIEEQQGDRSQAMRLTGPPVETIRIDAQLDAMGIMDDPAHEGLVEKFGVQAQISALESIIYPSSRHLKSVFAAAKKGVMEISPPQAPLVLFAWSPSRRGIPVRITELTIEEQFFDPNLHPIRAKVSLSMRVLNVNDIGFSDHSGQLAMAHHQRQERLASAGGSKVARRSIAGRIA